MQTKKESLFAYVALDDGGSETRGRICAIDEQDVKEKFLKNGLYLMSLQKIKDQEVEGWFPGIVD